MKRGKSPKADRLRTERNTILQPHRTRIVGKGKDDDRIQEYRPSQQGRRRIDRLNVLIYNRFFHYCGLIGTTPLQEVQQNNNET